MTLQYLSEIYLSWIEPVPAETCFEAKCTMVLGIALVSLTCMWCSGKKGRGPAISVTVEARRPTYKFTRSGRTYGKYD
ncbi:hypothetical protein KUF71_004704 [Frankliniella fusca]|uniref:Uncharacterized protein n=1 Tax=Frankliniella fusca TaxID=407009 RepID=A0AAE1LBJ8_9NEOP|nr:hypothetical protein KUF71_004704 [Frankliniella fusca]